MRVNVAVLAKSQSLRDDFDSLQRPRRGKGITSPDDLCYLSDYLKRQVLHIEKDTESPSLRGRRCNRSRLSTANKVMPAG